MKTCRRCLLKSQPERESNSPIFLSHIFLSKAVYNSMFREWNTQSGVRSYPRIVFQDEEEMGKVYFPPKLVPIVQHPLVVKLGPSVSREILIQHLYNYLEFTS